MGPDDAAGEVTVSNRVRRTDSWEGWCGIVRSVAILTLLAAATIHATVIRPHFAEWWAAGVFFLLLALTQIVLAVALALRMSRWLVSLAIGISLLTIALWAASRTAGLPFGPEIGTPESIGAPDLVATGMELVTAVSLLAWILLPAGGTRLRQSVRNAGVALSCVAIGSVTWAGLQLAPLCGPSHGSSWPFGPLVPIDGHSMLSRHTPVALVPAGSEVGIVVGEFRNCGRSEAVVRSARLLTATGTATKLVGFWVAPLSVASPGKGIPKKVLVAHAVPLPGEVHVPPAVRPTQVLVLEVKTSAVKGAFGPAYTVDGFRVRYAAGGHSYDAPFASIGRLRIKPSGRGQSRG